MTFLRRLVFVLGIPFCLLFAFLYWLFTGRSGSEVISRFDHWGTDPDEVA